MLTNAEALALVQKQQDAEWSVTDRDVRALLHDVRGTTFAGLTQVTPVKLAAQHEGEAIYKVTVGSVQLFNGLSEFTNAYELAVKRSAKKLGESAANIAQFKSSGNWFEHDGQCYSIVHHATNKNKAYLFGIYNKADSLYVMYKNAGPLMGGWDVVSKEVVAQYMTPSEARKLLAPAKTTYNVSQDLEHDVVVRTVALENVVSLRAMGKQVEIV